MWVCMVWTVEDIYRIVFTVKHVVDLTRSDGCSFMRGCSSEKNCER